MIDTEIIEQFFLMHPFGAFAVAALFILTNLAIFVLKDREFGMM